MRALPAFYILAGSFSVLSWSLAAQAQTPSIALDRLQLAPAGDPFLTIQGASAAANRLSVQLAGSYGRAPLTHVTPERELAVVRYQAAAHASIAWEALGRLKLDVSVPLWVAQAGQATSTARWQMPAPDERTVGQPRVGARLTLLRQTRSLPAVAVSVRAYLPHGAQDTYAGSDQIRFQPSLVVSSTGPRWAWGASVWRTTLTARDSYQDLAGSEVGLGAAVAMRAGSLQAGPEGYASTVADGRTSAFRDTTTFAELLMAARWSAGPLSFALAAGPGLGRGAGTPSYRLLAALSYSSSPEDCGATGMAAEREREWKPPAPAAAAPRRHAPIPADSDADTVPDATDACPAVPGDPAGARRGCPPDGDGDGIADSEDRCPSERGGPDPDPARHGCPPDRDGDGIADEADACPLEKGPRTAEPKTNGCPEVARIQGPQIVIQQQILFETAKDVLLQESIPVLQAMATLLNDHPEIARVAVDGHTDNAGGDGPNLQLSQRRSLSVMRWLIDHGVDARRLESRAFGMRRPVADNRTPEGRAKNRRVEFLIRRRTDKGEAGWADGPVP